MHERRTSDAGFSMYNVSINASLTQTRADTFFTRSCPVENLLGHVSCLLFTLSLSTAASKSRRVANWVSCSHEVRVKGMVAHIETMVITTRNNVKWSACSATATFTAITEIGKSTAITLSHASPCRGRHFRWRDVGQDDFPEDEVVVY